MIQNASYRETVSWLFGLQKFGVKLGLDSVTRLLELLGNPHRNLRYIHIAGTNGKGSTAAYLHSIYNAAGYRPGLYTSPHLVDFTERIVVGDAPIHPETVVERVRQLRELCRCNNLEHITFFEFSTALALMYFAEQKADPVILETGLGGRLDATNVIDPMISIITSISREHTAFLGPTLLHITHEKAGIIKPRRPCISGVSRIGPRDYIRQVCDAKSAQLFEYGRDFSMRRLSNSYCYRSCCRNYSGLHPGLAGHHQARNAALAITAGEYLRTQGYPITDANVSDGIQSCVWPGRFESVQQSPRHIVLDGAHNPAAWQALMRSLKKECGQERLVLIIGIMRDKDMQSIRRFAAQAHICIFFKPVMERSADRVFLEKYIVFSQEKKVFWCESISRALVLAVEKTGPRDLICVTGSLFAVGEARELLCGCSTDHSGRIGM